MSAGREDLVQPKVRLPDLALPSARGGAEQRLRAGGRLSPVLVLVHPGACAGCAEFVAQLAAAAPALEEWDGRVLVITPDPPQEGQDAGGAFPLLSDPERRLSAALGITPPAVVVADQWGEVHLAGEAGEGHGFPAVAELEQWVRYLAVQCPECEGEAF
jgi:peroxiredoxin